MSRIPPTVLYLLAGFALGAGGLGLLDLDPRSDLVTVVTTVALVVILFRDGLEVEGEMLQTAWHLPLRKLALAMPLTCVIVALGARALTDLGWAECFLLGALLSPTDPVLSSSVVTNPRVPRLVRHSLNLESGLNDGLALPAVLAFAAALEAGQGDFVWWHFVLQDVTLGFAFGIGLGLLASVLLPRRGVPAALAVLLALAVAFATYGIAVGLPPGGNGLIAVFTCAITVAVRRDDVREAFEARAGPLVEAVKLAVFVVFGALLTLAGLFGDGWAAVAVVAVTLLLARPVAIWIALLGTRVGADVTAFMAWFGPKGVATMTFSLLVLGKSIEQGERIFDLAALCVVVSILVHGLTDAPGAEWLARRAARPAPGR